MTTATHRGTANADEFSALCNLFHTTHCEEFDPSAQQCGDILYHGANRTVCDHSRLITRAVLAYLGISTEYPDADELILEIRAALLDGEGSLSQEDQ